MGQLHLLLLVLGGVPVKLLGLRRLLARLPSHHAVLLWVRLLRLCVLLTLRRVLLVDTWHVLLSVLGQLLGWLLGCVCLRCILPLSHVLRLRPLLLLGRWLDGRLGLKLLVVGGLGVLLVVHVRRGCIGVSGVHVRGTRLLPRVRGVPWVRLHGLDIPVRLLTPSSNYFNHLSGLAKTLVLFNETLVDLAQMQFLLAVGKVLQIHEVAVGHGVGIFKKLVLLQINLQCLGVWKVV